MKKYRVYGVVTGTKFLGEYEAEDEREAENMALRENGHVSVCNHCADEIDEPAIDDVIVEEA